MDRFYQKTVQQTLDALKTRQDGLSPKEVQDRQVHYGLNRIAEAKPKGILQVFIEQFADLLVIILMIAAVISVFTKNAESAIVIFAVIILNAILGTIQHFKAEKSLQSLKELSSPTAKVIRSGQKSEIDASQIVPGDLILLEAGDLIPADGRILENYSLQVNESALTGESESVNKSSDPIFTDHVALGDQINMVFSGSLVTYGRAVAVITSTGMNTEIGKIAAIMNATKERKTPLQISLDRFSQKLSFLIILICLLVFLLGLYQKMPVIDSLMFAVALAVAAIPEALSSIVTISLAIGTSKMAKENAIIKNLRAVEGLGCVSVICSDKTGTLTQNKMTVSGIFSFISGCPKQLLLSSVLCNDSYVSDEKLIGDPTETALIDYYRSEHSDLTEIQNAYPRISEIPFDSNRKRMSTLHQINSELILFTKGAVDGLMQRITQVMDDQGIRPITEDDRDIIEQQNQIMSENGLRVLTFVQKVMTKTAIDLSDEDEYTFLGLISMIDPPREESAAAVADCYTAGIKPIMITGDHITTASAIAKKIEILKSGDLAVTGAELDQMPDHELKKLLPNISVYARVSPEHKIRIVDLWQKSGHIVAMTGDGVNDAPALKKADIGIAMGITGTAVSKDAASMILTDDNFATIIKAVVNGRNIYANIKNSIKFLLSGNTSGILTVLYTSLLALPLPFSAVQLLFINLLTDSLPAIAIGMEKPAKDLLQNQPRNSKEPILTKKFLIQTAIQGVLITLFTLLAYYQGLAVNPETAGTMAFATLCMSRLWHGFNSRSDHSLFYLGFLSNLYSIGAFLLGSVFLACALFIPPIQQLFDVTPLSANHIWVVLLCAFMPTLIIQCYRTVAEKIKKKRGTK